MPGRRRGRVGRARRGRRTRPGPGCRPAQRDLPHAQLRRPLRVGGAQEVADAVGLELGHQHRAAAREPVAQALELAELRARGEVGGAVGEHVAPHDAAGDAHGQREPEHPRPPQREGGGARQGARDDGRARLGERLAGQPGGPEQPHGEGRRERRAEEGRDTAMAAPHRGDHGHNRGERHLGGEDPRRGQVGRREPEVPGGPDPEELERVERGGEVPQVAAAQPGEVAADEPAQGGEARDARERGAREDGPARRPPGAQRQGDRRRRDEPHEGARAQRRERGERDDDRGHRRAGRARPLPPGRPSRERGDEDGPQQLLDPAQEPVAVQQRRGGSEPRRPGRGGPRSPAPRRAAGGRAPASRARAGRRARRGRARRARRRPPPPAARRCPTAGTRPSGSRWRS